MAHSFCIITNSQNDKLRDMSREFFPSHVEVIDFNGKDGLYGFEFLMAMMKDERLLKYTHAIYIDNDCFVVSWEQVEYTFKRFIINSYCFAGMPDGGTISHRISSDELPNLFFMFFDLEQMRMVWDEDAIRSTSVNMEVRNAYKNRDGYKRIDIVRSEGFVPFSIGVGYNEPYYKIFSFLKSKGLEYMGLDAEDAPQVDDDGACTALMGLDYGQDDLIMCYHSWFAREYGKDKYHTDRINRVYEYAKSCLHKPIGEQGQI